MNVSEFERSPSATVTVNSSLPKKSWSGLNVKSLPTKSAEILVPDVTLYVNKSPSTSDPDNKKLREPSSFILLSPTDARAGASLTAFTVTVIFCESVSSPSLTDTVNVSLPL